MLDVMIGVEKEKAPQEVTIHEGTPRCNVIWPNVVVLPQSIQKERRREEEKQGHEMNPTKNLPTEAP